MLWDRSGQALLRTPLPRIQRGEVRGCVWHPHEEFLLLWLEYEIILVDLHGTVRAVLPLRSSFGGWTDSTPYQWSPDGTILAASTESTVQLWTSRGHPQTILELSGEALSVAWNPAGDVLATAAWSNRIQLWTHTGDHITDLIIDRPGLGGAAMQIPFLLARDTTGQYLAASLRGCTVHLWGL
jgi:WD40 repeat protein